MTDQQAKKVPAAACCFDTGPVQFADEQPQAGRAPIKMVARTGQPIEHWYWGRAVHDLAGMKHKAKIPVDYIHRDDEIIGYLDGFDTSRNDLLVSGELVSFLDDDRAAEVSHKGQAGVPYEASIDFRGGGLRIEELAEGTSAQVNGYIFKGPGVIFREWNLRGVAVCPHGVDRNTNTKFDDETDEITVTIFSLEKSMSDQTETHPPAATETPADESTQTPADAKELAGNPDQPKSPPAKEPQAPDATAFRTELRRFVDCFGAENGVKWYGDGKTYAEALELQVKAQEAALVAKETEVKELKERLASLDRGEEEAVEFQGEGKEDNPKTKKFSQNLGDNVGRFAAGIKMPGGGNASRN